MKISRQLLAVFFAIFIIAPISVSAKTYTKTSVGGNKVSVNITSVNIDGRENQTIVSGTKPKVNSNNYSVASINEDIENIYKDSIKSAAALRAKSIVFSYEVFENSQYISVLVTSKIQNVTETTKCMSVNFSNLTGEVIELKDVLGGKPIDVVDKYVNKVLKEKNEYNKEVKIDDNQTFYMKNDVPVLVFDSYALDDNQTKIVEITVDLSDITSFMLNSKNYYIKDSFNIRMIPLRKTCEGLYYDVSWNGKTHTFTVTDDSITSTGSTSVNLYTAGSKKMALEYKPENNNGTLYVPISYFTDLLGLSYKIDSLGNITFYKI